MLRTHHLLFYACDFEVGLLRGILGTQQMLPKTGVIQRHEFASSFLILSVCFLEMLNEFFHSWVRS